MPHDLILSPQGSTLPARVERQIARQIATIDAQTAVASARETAKVALVRDVTSEALFGTAEIGAIAEMLASRTPSAEQALAHIASVGVSAMAEVVQRSSRAL